MLLVNYENGHFLTDDSGDRVSEKMVSGRQLFGLLLLAWSLNQDVINSLGEN